MIKTYEVYFGNDQYSVIKASSVEEGFSADGVELKTLKFKRGDVLVGFFNHVNAYLVRVTE